MGILNLTPDSFSDGGCFLDFDDAIQHAQWLIDSGADIVDVGGQSTRPGSTVTSVADELDRVMPTVEALSDSSASISIDTYHPEVADAACLAGAKLINDITGFNDPQMIQVAVRNGARCVLMHMQGSPQDMQDNPFYVDVVQEIGEFLIERAQKLELAGVPAESILLDPGFGFGKTYEHNLELFLLMDKLAQQIHEAGYSLLIGLSRKSMIGKLFGIENPKERDLASAQLDAALIAVGASVVRTHNPLELQSALDQQQRKQQSQQTVSAAYIGIGSNLGGPISNIATAINYLDGLPLTEVSKYAAPVLSEPAYDSNQAPFTNTVVRLETSLGPLALFAYMQAIELDMGRVKQRPNGPRVIDLDLLSYDDEIINLPALTVPHPRMNERDFVLEPLMQLAPDFCLPDGSLLAPAKHTYGKITAHLPMELLQTDIAGKRERLQRSFELSSGAKEGYTKDPYNWDNWKS